MNLLKTTFLTGISTVIKIISGFIINKVVAVYIGPSGLALIGQFQNFTAIIMSFSQNVMNQGIVKYVAEYKEEPKKRIKFLSTSFSVCLISALIMSVLLIIFNKQISFYLFKNDNYASIFTIFGATLVFFALNNYFLAVLNGYREVKKFVSINMISSIVSLIFTTILIKFLGFYGALLSLVTAQTVVFIITLLFVVKSNWFKFENFIKGSDKENLIKIFKFSLMVIIPSIIGPFIQLNVRDYIINHISLDAAGYWQGIWKISDVYLMLITSSIGIYYLPKLSEIKDDVLLKKEIISGYKTILPIVAIIALGIFFCRDLIIRILFTEKFMDMSNLFTFQLIGDFLKVSSWLLSYNLVAKARVKIVIFTELLFYSLFLTFSILFINKFGLIGVTYAFALDYFIYLLIMIYLFKNLLFKQTDI